MDKLPQFKQRIALSYSLTHLTEAETKNYIEYRCGLAGREDKLFSQEAYASIYQYSNGIPRMINNVCDVCFLKGMNKNALIIGDAIVKEAISQLR